eukprot:TRINITY_DN291_c0_g2_i1.p1 TRINITY_DN291_c0_g2~~TRINITY_DN291_c0_g2_i1.p1  ORF type:complete len:345 (+),score=58.90 TRINITY_DN291_c0_g2_i1:94-1128(+)
MTREERQQFLKHFFETNPPSGPVPKPLNLFVKNLSDEIDDEALRAMFAPFGELGSVKVMRHSDPSKVSKGFGFVQFKNVNDGEKALQMHGKMVGTKPIYVAPAMKLQQRRAQLEQVYAQTRAYPTPTALYSPAVVFQGMQQPPFQRMSMFTGPPRWVPSTALPQRSASRTQMPPYMTQMVTSMSNQARRPQRQPPTQKSPIGQAISPAVVQQVQVGQAQTDMAQMQVMTRQQQVKLNAGTRNAPQAYQPPQIQTEVKQAQPLDSQELVGERLYMQVSNVPFIAPQNCGKITGMLLESLGVPAVMRLLNEPAELQKKIQEANAVYEAHVKKLAGQTGAGGPENSQ